MLIIRLAQASLGTIKGETEGLTKNRDHVRQVIEDLLGPGLNTHVGEASEGKRYNHGDIGHSKLRCACQDLGSLAVTRDAVGCSR